jgi:hypothetical protein
MKKGDIVSLKSGVTIQDASTYYIRDSIKTEQFYTVKTDPQLSFTRGCQPEQILTVEFEEVEYTTFNVKYLNVVLEAGKPDINELLKETERELVYS